MKTMTIQKLKDILVIPLFFAVYSPPSLAAQSEPPKNESNMHRINFQDIPENPWINSIELILIAAKVQSPSADGIVYTLEFNNHSDMDINIKNPLDFTRATILKDGLPVKLPNDAPKALIHSAKGVISGRPFSIVSASTIKREKDSAIDPGELSKDDFQISAKSSCRFVLRYSKMLTPSHEKGAEDKLVAFTPGTYQITINVVLISKMGDNASRSCTSGKFEVQLQDRE